MRPLTTAGPATFGGALSGSAASYRSDLEVVAGMLRALGHNAAATPSGPAPGVPDRRALLEQARQAQAFIRHCGDNAEHYGSQPVDNPLAAPLAGAYNVAMSHAATVHRHLGAALDLSIKYVQSPPDRVGSPAEALRLRRAEHAAAALDNADQCAVQGAEAVLAFAARLPPSPSRPAPAAAAQVITSPAASAPSRRRG
ncbi:hypothetical protein ACFXAF_19325 [Kitasatospora sp. NPDC059463]|uniref:hypothetical protein n=1 Tax=unclassified Kitasatospora TaxID=2633591 RepID=UPI0036A044DE